MNDITALMATMKAAAELIAPGYKRNWIVSHDDETCWVGANDDDGNLTPFIEVSIGDWSDNKTDNERLAAFIALAHPANVKTLVEALEKAQAQSSKWLEAYHKAVSVGARYEERIAELESYSKTAIEFREAARDENRHLKLELEIAERRIVELEGFRTAYMEWSDKTKWVQKDKRFDVLKPWGKHRADVLKEYIEHLESRNVTVKLPEPFKLAKSSSGLIYYYADEIDKALADAGINVEAE